jgi:peptide/nickel transport system permease protein
MAAYIVRRILGMIPTLMVVSVIVFIIIQLPPGDFFTTLQSELAATGGGQDKEAIKRLEEIYGLDKPVVVQYLRWIAGFPKLDFGYSLEWNASVWNVISSKLAYTVFLGVLSVLFMALVAVPIGIYSATHQYALGDTFLSGLGFLALSIPGFLLALVWMFVGILILHWDVGGILSEKMANAPWTLAKVWDYIVHLIPAVIILGLSSVAQIQRIMRSSLLDVLGQQHITTARAKGLEETKVINKYAVRVAINPVITVLALEMSKIISTSILVGIVMMLPTLGPILLRALRSQDMYLAGTILLVSTALLMVSNLIADILLAWVDPRITYE